MDIKIKALFNFKAYIKAKKTLFLFQILKHDTDSYVFKGPVFPIFIKCKVSNLIVPQWVSPKVSRIAVASKGFRLRFIIFIGFRVRSVDEEEGSAGVIVGADFVP